MMRLGWQVCMCLHCKIMLCCQKHLVCVCVTIQAFSLPLCAFPYLCPKRCLPFPYRKDHTEQLGDSSGVSAAAGTALANAEAAAGAQHRGRHAGIQIVAGQPGHGAEEPRGKHSLPSIKAWCEQLLTRSPANQCANQLWFKRTVDGSWVIQKHRKSWQEVLPELK